jgi:glycyl-tRNA synthetase
MGPVEDEGSVVYLRPETAQGIFVNFDNVAVSMRKKIPFGIAQIGKSFRNEITPGNFIFRTREFEQMEMQFFVKPGTDMEWFETWKATRWDYYKKIGIRENKLRFKEHGPKELAHYAKAAFDVQYEFPFGWNELEGIHNRSDFDLREHQKFSGKKLEYFDEATKDRYIPYVIETAVGCDRLALTLLCDAYREEKTAGEGGEDGDTRVVLGLKPDFAPISVAVLPLSKKPQLQEIAMKLREHLAARDLDADYDETGSIGKRYRRQDEIGTPLCATVDFESIEDQKVTVRHRDKMTQDRIAIDQIESYIKEKLVNF